MVSFPSLFGRLRPTKALKCFLIGVSCLAMSSLWTIRASSSSGRIMAHADDAPSTEPTLPRKSQHINYRLEPGIFVKELTTCFEDDDCRIYYLHFGKSGGSGLENRMFKAFPPYQDSFMRGNMLQRFQENPSNFCNAKFSSYQVSSPDFINTIVPTCMKETGSRAIILVSFREPIQRSLSYIHQMCNKYQRHRNKVTRQACSRCSYEQDSDFWNTHIIQHFNQEYDELQKVTTAEIVNASVLSVDMVDLSLLYDKLYAAIRHEAFSLPQTTNTEATQRCNFGFKSEMFRGLAPSSDVYRNLTLAKYA